MSSGIFLLQKNGALVEMNQKDYDSEDILQELLEKYPNLISGNLVDELNPRKWILISRELSVPDTETSQGRWSLDHLFIDQDGIPTLVEVKRSSDTRIRREVVGQMLDYAANAVTFWDIDKIRILFETRCENEGLDPEHIWYESFQLEDGYDEYWLKVRTNLETGRIRMLFVADEIPFELKQIVEFLNEQMNPAEILALEIKQYVGQNQKTLIPRIYGQTSKLQRKKTRTSRPLTNQTTFLESLNDTCHKFFDHLLDRLTQQGLVIRWGTVGFSINVDFDGMHVGICQGYPPKLKGRKIPCVYGIFNTIEEKLVDTDKLVEEFKEKFIETGFFVPSGNKNVRWSIASKPSMENIQTIVDIYADLANNLKNFQTRE